MSCCLHTHTQVKTLNTKSKAGWEEKGLTLKVEVNKHPIHFILCISKQIGNKAVWNILFASKYFFEREILIYFMKIKVTGIILKFIWVLNNHDPNLNSYLRGSKFHYSISTLFLNLSIQLIHCVFMKNIRHFIYNLN